jgi:hypothetical protein
MNFLQVLCFLAFLSIFPRGFIILATEILTRENAMKNIAIVFSSIVFFVTTAAATDAYKLEVERNGTTYLQVALNTWQGEYPGPVIDVSSKKKNQTTTVKAWESLRSLSVSKLCTIQNGLYHPWSQTKNSVINYYTLVPAVDYVAIKNVPADVGASFWPEVGNKVTIKAGDKILNVVYLAEGISMATLVSKGTKQTIYVDYGALDNKEFFKNTLETKSLKTGTHEDGSTYSMNEQWLYVKCAEGYNAFIEDVELLKYKGVKEGDIYDWGSVVGAK